MSDHRITFQIRVDDEELAHLQAEAGDDENFFGRPRDWRSLLELMDAQRANVILRSEIVGREHDIKVVPYGAKAGLGLRLKRLIRRAS